MPAAALDHDVVAQIEIVELLDIQNSASGGRTYSYRIKVRVLRAIKGLEEGQVITVSSGGSTCDQHFEKTSIGMKGYVAGRLTKSERDDLVFVGRWDWKGKYKH